jgi:Fic family protein
VIYETPPVGPEKRAALDRIEEVWRQLGPYVADSRRWVGSVRRILAARANQFSNSIEGYNVSTEDAIAALQGATEPVDSQWEDWQANLGYRRAMTYVLQLARDDCFEYSPVLLRSLHYMMTEYSLEAGPGLWRPGPIWVQNSTSGEVVYEAPVADEAPGLVDELIGNLNGEDDCPPLVRASMAHLNLVLIHPFRDGNGRMGRALQSLVLVREGFLARELCSIEEYLGQPGNQQRYYDTLTEVAKGSWSPNRASRPWVRFCLEAHYVQALSVLRRIRESERIWEGILGLAGRDSLPPRATEALFDATMGLRVRNASYRATLAENGEEISAQTATNDFRELVRSGLLLQEGSKRGAHYIAGGELRELRAKVLANRTPIKVDGLFDPQDPLPGDSGGLTQASSLFPAPAGA